jgi:hypothetical protein
MSPLLRKTLLCLVLIGLAAAVDTAEVFSYPNPFNLRDYKEVKFYFPANSNVRLTICNILGEPVATLKEENIFGGWGWAFWDGKDDKGSLVASGMYFFFVKTRGYLLRGKMTIIR